MSKTSPSSSARGPRPRSNSGPLPERHGSVPGTGPCSFWAGATLLPMATVELHVISDATGATAKRLVQALEAQFPDQEFEDIVHPPIDAVARVPGHPATMPPGARPPLDSNYFKRMAAIEFAVKYDDGVTGGLEDADIVLVGVSRTSKTPLSIYLGYLGYRTANVPVVKGIEPPDALFGLDPKKVVGLTIDAERLAEIRTDRARRLGGNNRRYRDLMEISELSIEETAARVIQVVEQRRRAAAPAS